MSANCIPLALDYGFRPLLHFVLVPPPVTQCRALAGPAILDVNILNEGHQRIHRRR